MLLAPSFAELVFTAGITFMICLPRAVNSTSWLGGGELTTRYREFVVALLATRIFML